MRPNWRIDADELIGFTQQLVRIRSVYETEPPSDESQVAHAVAARMRRWGWEPVITEVAPRRLNVVAVLDGGLPGPTLMFEGHTDVVSEGDADTWSFPPFSAEIQDGRMLGRGTADMKAGLAAAMYAARAIEQRGPFPGRIVLAALCDEEGMMLGAKHFAQQPLASEIDGVIVCEPEDYEVCAVSKGAMRLRINVHGRMAHGAMPQHGRNPVPVVASIITQLGSLQARLQKRNGPHAYLGNDTITATVMRAGEDEQLNVISALAYVLVDVRTTPAVSHEELLFDIRQIAEQTALEADCKSDVEVIDDRPPVDTPVEAPVVVALVEAHERVLGSAPSYGGIPGMTDGTILVRDAGLQSVVYGPGDKWIAHQVDEWVAVDDIITCAQVYAETASIFLNVGRR